MNDQGSVLLRTLASHPESQCWKEFDALFYEIVWKYLRRNSDKLGARVGRHMGYKVAIASHVLQSEVDEVAHEASKLALRRVRQNASRFDPNRGSALGWVLGAAEFAYVEVAKAIIKDRRSERLVFAPPEELVDTPDPNPTPEDQVLDRAENREILEAAATQVTDKEFAALRLVVTAGYSYAETAEAIFGDPSMTKQVDGLLTRGKRKLGEAWRDRRPPTSSGKNTRVPSPSDDEEDANE